MQEASTFHPIRNSVTCSRKFEFASLLDYTGNINKNYTCSAGRANCIDSLRRELWTEWSRLVVNFGYAKVIISATTHRPLAHPSCIPLSFFSGFLGRRNACEEANFLGNSSPINESPNENASNNRKASETVAWGIRSVAAGTTVLVPRPTS